MVRQLVTGVAAIGTSVIDSGGLYTSLDTALIVPTTDLSYPGSPVNDSGNYCMRAQVDRALALPGYNCAVLDGDNEAASLIYQHFSAQESVDQYREQIDRLLAANWLVIACLRGVGVADGVAFGPILRGPTAAMYRTRPRVRVVDVWAIEDHSDDLAHVIPGTGGHTVGDMFSDTPPVADHYTSYGATVVAAAIVAVFNRYARTS